MKKTLLILLTLFLISNLAYAQIISQYVETNSGTSPKGIEVWNNTAATLDFSVNNLVIEKGTNGGTPSTDVTVSTGILAPGAVIIIGTSDMSAIASTNGATFVEKSFSYNGDDALVIKYGGVITDVFGTPGQDPGSDWSGNSVSTANQNIALVEGITTGDTDGWTDPSERFQTISTNPSGTGGLEGFGIAPSGGGSVDETSVFFASGSASINEDGGTIDLTISITNEDASNATSLDVVLVSGSADDIGLYATVPVTFAAGSAADQTVTVTITDDAVSEGDETLTFEIQNVTGGNNATAGVPNQFQLTIVDNEVPEITSLPYTEDFANCGTSLWTTVSISGNRDWTCGSGYMEINAYGGDVASDDYLISPVINLDNFSDEVLTFESFTRYSDAVHPIELVYTTNYTGDPSTTTWQTLVPAWPDANSATWTSSGNVELSEIAGTSVRLAFHYISTGTGGGTTSLWQIDNILIDEVSAPSITIAPTVLTGFTYMDVDGGPSEEQSFIVSGVSLTDNITVTSPANYEISTETGVAFTPQNSVTLTQNAGSVENTTIYVRLKSGLAIGTYNEVITASSAGAADQTVTLSGNVTGLPALVINEVLADPDAATGDANNDGITHYEEDEFVEIINTTDIEINLTGYTLSDEGSVRHIFTEGSVLPAGEAVVVFGGGTPTEIPGGLVVTASEGPLYLNNSGDIITLADNLGNVIDTYTYGSEGGDNQSICRNPDITGNFVKHLEVAGNAVAFSPGRNNADNSALPVELTSFSGAANGKTVTLVWETATEVNNYGFEIERQAANEAWVKLGFVNGAGNSATAKKYSYSDASVSKTGVYAYRLKQVDMDGTFTYSNAIEVALTKPVSFDLSQNYPNPFNPSTNINFSLAEQVKVKITVYNALGEQIAVIVDKNMDAGNYSVTFDAAGLNSGIYFYNISAIGANGNDFNQTRKMIVLK